MAEVLPFHFTGRVRNLRGLVFGRLEVKEFAGLNKHGQAAWLCACSCGANTAVLGYHLTSAHTKSCSCAQREFARNVGRNNRTHGLTKHLLYTTWANMLHRCHNPRCHQFKYYRARGVTVCQRWHNVTAFIEDIEHILGPRPSGMELDRIDNELGYFPGNVRWLSSLDQKYNTRSMAALVRKIKDIYSEIAA